MSDLKKALREFAATNNLSETECAEFLDISPHTFHKWWSGERKFTRSLDHKDKLEKEIPGLRFVKSSDNRLFEAIYGEVVPEGSNEAAKPQITVKQEMGDETLNPARYPTKLSLAIEIYKRQHELTFAKICKDWGEQLRLSKGKVPYTTLHSWASGEVAEPEFEIYRDFLNEKFPGVFDPNISLDNFSSRITDRKEQMTDTAQEIPEQITQIIEQAPSAETIIAPPESKTSRLVMKDEKTIQQPVQTQTLFLPETWVRELVQSVMAETAEKIRTDMDALDLLRYYKETSSDLDAIRRIVEGLDQRLAQTPVHMGEKPETSGIEKTTGDSIVKIVFVPIIHTNEVNSEIENLAADISRLAERIAAFSNLPQSSRERETARKTLNSPLHRLFMAMEILDAQYPTALHELFQSYNQGITMAVQKSHTAAHTTDERRK